MTVLKINGVEFEADEKLQAVQTTDDQAPLQADPYDTPFQDEVCFELINPPAGEPKFYIARLHAKNDLSNSHVGDTLEVTQGDTVLNGKIAWVSDEQTDATYTLGTIDVKFGYPRGNDWVPANEIDYDFKFDKLEKQILKRIKLEEGDEIDFANYQVSEFQVKEAFNDKLADVYIQPIWVGDGKINLRLFAIPPANEAQIEIQVDSADPSLGPKVAPYLAEAIALYFKAPLTEEALEEAQQKADEYFKDHTKFSLMSFDNPVYQTDGTVTIKANLLPISESEPVLQTVRLDKQGDVVAKIELRGDDLPIEITLPMNINNITSNKEALREFYGELGYVAQFEGKPLVGEIETVFQIVLHPSPSQIEFTTSFGPTPEEVSKMFLDDRYNYVTATSIGSGLEQLTEWYVSQGYQILETPGWVIEGDVLKVATLPLEVIKYEWKYIEEDGHLHPLPADRQEALEREIPKRDTNFLNTHDLERALTIMNQNYPYKVSHELRVNSATGKTIVVFIVDTKKVIDLGVGGSMIAFRQGMGGTSEVSLDYQFVDGRTVGGSVFFYADPNKSALSPEAHYSVPWVIAYGADLTTGVYSTIPFKGNFPARLGAYGIMSHPFPDPHSPWRAITGLDVQGIIGNQYEDEGVWFKPEVGIKYTERFSGFQATTGPAVNPMGSQAYYETEAEFGLSPRLTDAFNSPYLDFSGSAGLRASGTELPFGQKYGAQHMLPTYAGPSPVLGPTHFETRADFVFPFTPSGFPLPMAQGAGISFDIMGDPENMRVGFGSRTDIGGSSLLIGAYFLPASNNPNKVYPGLHFGGNF